MENLLNIYLLFLFFLLSQMESEGHKRDMVEACTSKLYGCISNIINWKRTPNNHYENKQKKIQEDSNTGI